MAPQQAASPYNEAGQSSSSELRFTFPVDKLEAYLLEKKLEGFVAPLKAEQFGMGQSNPTYKLISANGTTYVMRKKPPGGLVSSTAHQIEREYKIISAINRNVPDFPVPKAYLLEEREEIIGGGFFIMSFIEGRIFADPRLWSVQSAKDKEELWLSAARTLARLHKYTPKQLGLENLSAPGSTFYPRQLKSFTKLSQQQAKAIKDGGGVKGVAGTGDIPNFEEKLKWLENNIETVPKSEGVLMHGDFKFDNLIIHPTKNEVIAVLDWELCTLGHPLADLAHFVQVYHLPYPHGMVDTPPNAPKANIPPLSKVLAAYASESSMKISYPILGWKMAVSFGLFRRAVISQGIEARRVRGQANSAFAEARGWGMVEVWSGALSKAINGQINVDEGGAEGGYSKL